MDNQIVVFFGLIDEFLHSLEHYEDRRPGLYIDGEREESERARV